MKYSLALISILSLISCATSKQVPLKGNYFTPPYIIKANKSFDQVWDKLVDVFAQNGLPIKIIDRASGLIIANVSSMDVTYEKKDGSLSDPKAVVVTNLVYNWGQNKYSPIATEVNGDWNVRIKPIGKDSSSININVGNLQYYDAVKKIYSPVTSFRSTGVWEKEMLSLLNEP